MERLLENAIQTSRQIDSEAREETLRGHLQIELRKALRRNKVVTAAELVDSLSEFPRHRVLGELQKMKARGLVVFEDDALMPDSAIRLPTIRERTTKVEG